MASRAMVQTTALVVDTFREAFARKIIWGFIICSTLLILFFLVLVKIDVVQGGIAMSFIFNNRSGRVNKAEDVVRGVHAGIAATLYVYGLILAVLASAGLIPTIFEPGRIELLLSKPVERIHILLGRYLGNILLVALNVFYPVLALWILFGAKTGIWTGSFLWSSILTVFIFCCVFSCDLADRSGVGKRGGRHHGHFWTHDFGIDSVFPTWFGKTSQFRMVP